MRRLPLALAIILASAGPIAQGAITSPQTEFGHHFGDDYFLANYKQLAAYWQKIDRESDRMTLQSIGKTAEGRDQLMAIVTSPANHKNLAKYKDISQRLALAEGLTDDQARALAREGKAVVWIDGGLHANETLGAQQLGEMIYQMVSRNDEETRRILDEVIILFVHANPDGNDLVADWYMRNPDPKQRSSAQLPRLYHQYIGHDNNRDFFASTQAETENMNRVLYREWFPQVLYNHHQSGPQGTVLWSPPLRDPFNYNQDPLLVLGIQTIGLAIHTRLAAENKPGATMRSGGPYDGWWNGGIRNTAAFHNTIAILTEMIGNPTPMRIPLVMERQLPTSDLTFPVPPQEWRFRQSVDYSIACNRGVLDVVSKMRENFLYNRFVMGRNSIERGSRDTWTPKPHRYAAAVASVAGGREGGAGAAGGGGRGGGNANQDALWAALRKPEDRDPRAFIVPAGQPDFPTATRFINALLETGIRVHRARATFTARGKSYPAGSYVVFAAQAFRPHVIDMFEPQDHPDNFPYPGAPPTRPYDLAGWTLAFQMGVEFDRILDPFTPADGPFEVIEDWNLPPSPATAPAGTPAAFGVKPAQLDTFVAVNRLLAAKQEVYRVSDGSFVVANNPASQKLMLTLARERGVRFEAIAARPMVVEPRLTTPRVGLWDTYGGSMDSGWARWILEQFEFPFTRVFAPELDAGNLNAKYDVLIFVEGGIPAAGAGGGRGGGGGAGGRGAGPAGPPADLPAEFRSHFGSVTADRTVPPIKQFIESGGTVIAIGGSAANLARHLALPLENHLAPVLNTAGQVDQTKFYAPGSVLRARVDTTNPVAAGMKPETDIFFDNSPVWKLTPGASAGTVKAIAWFDSPTPLRSGWAWGQHYLDKGIIAVDAKVGKGRALLFGAEIIQRAQPHGTFKFLFNGIYSRPGS
jgi:hypothetical protein